MDILDELDKLLAQHITDLKNLRQRVHEAQAAADKVVLDKLLARASRITTKLDKLDALTNPV